MPPSEQPSKVAKPSARIMRLITACLRCRLKKIKCDRKFPTCTNCAKSDSACVVKDPSTGEEVLRFTIHGLETRLQELTEELNTLKMERLTYSQPLEPAPSTLTFSKVLLMKDSDVSSVLNPECTEPNAPLRELVESCVVSFFTISNIQVPILHRDHYLFKYFRPLYKTIGPDMWKEILGDSFDRNSYAEEPYSAPVDSHTWNKCLFFLHIIIAILTSQRQQKYPLSISNHHKNEAFRYVDHIWREADGSDRNELAKLEMLQSLLLLTQYSLMRPCSPGAWYLIGTSVRLCQDLGLHNEMLYLRTREPFIVDLRRRLFWSCYSLDRQISMYFGRLFGLNSRQIDCPLFSALDDLQIIPVTQTSCLVGSWLTSIHSSKDVSLHFIMLRIIQGDLFDYISDIGNRVLPRDAEVDEKRWFESLRLHDQWKEQKHRELLAWYQKSPTNAEDPTFHNMVLKLNLNQVIIQIYGLSNITPVVIHDSHHEILYKAAKEIIWTYVELTERNLINFSWVAINNLFLGGSAYLTLISLSSELRNSLPLGDIRKDCAGVMLVFDELCKICFEPANGYSKKFEAQSRAIIEQCQRERRANAHDENPSESIPKTQSESNVFSSMGGTIPANFVFGSLRPQSDRQEDNLQRAEPQETRDNYGGFYESEDLVKKTIGSVDASYGDIFDGLGVEDAFLSGNYS